MLSHLPLPSPPSLPLQFSELALGTKLALAATRLISYVALVHGCANKVQYPRLQLTVNTSDNSELC